MKRILFITLALVITLAGWCNQTTEGTEFYAAFVNNRNSESPQLRLHIIGINSATVTISNDLMGWSTSVDVLQGGTAEVSVPAAYCYQSESGKSSRSLHITATAPVSVYASNTTDLSGDATLLIPVSGLGTDYMAQTTVSQAMFPAYVTAVATQDNTTVSITPTAQTVLNQPAGEPFSITLNRGEAYTVFTKNMTESLSGTRLKADKEIAVFHGNSYTYVPNDAYMSSSHLFEQAFPTPAWGSHFVFTSAVGQVRTLFLVTALTNNTIIMMNGEVWETLDAGETDFYIVYESQDASFIDATGPICCYQYLPSRENNDPPYGNPSMVWVTPLEQLTTHAMFTTLDNSYTKHFLNIIVSTQDIDKITNNGNIISLPFSPVPFLDSFSYARVTIPANRVFDLYAEHGITGTCYGIGSEISYAMNIGSAADVVNDGENVILRYTNSAEVVTCSNEPYIFNGKSLTETGIYTETFRARNGRDSIVTLDLTVYHTEHTTLDVALCEGERFQWQDETFEEAGTYERTLHTIHDCDSVITINITPLPAFHFEEEAEICAGEKLEWHGKTLEQGGDYTAAYKTVDDCDSIYTIHLTVHPRYQHSFTEQVCRRSDALASFTWNGETFSESGDYTRQLSTVYGCDSTVTLRLRFIEPVITTIADTIVYGETYEWDGMTYTAAGDYERVYERGNGCDSIVTLQLAVNHLTTAVAPQIETQCADAGDSQLDLHITGGWYDEVRIHYPDSLAVYGFKNDTLLMTTTDASLLTIDLPATAKAGVYTMNLTLLFHGKTVLDTHVRFTLLYPSSVIEQAWNDVLAVLTHDYNGGYDFVAFQWYKNGSPMPGATHSYISEPLQDGDHYSCLLTDSRGVKLMTCEMESSSKSKIRISPTMLQASETLTVELPEETVLGIYDLNGRQVLSATLQAGIHNLSVPALSGIYLVKLTTPSAQRSEKIIVK